MNIKEELIKYAKWYDRATMPEDAQTDEADLVQNVESYLQTEGKNIVLSDVLSSDFWWVGKTVSYDHNDENVTCIVDSVCNFDNEQYSCPKHAARPPLKVIKQFKDHIKLADKTIIRKEWAKIID